MNYDLDFRYRRALQPDALATIPTATQAVVDAMQDARNAGIDPARDPATILLARHVGRIALGHAPDETFAEDLPLRRQCLAKIDELKSKPALVALARRGIGYDPEAKTLVVQMNNSSDSYTYEGVPQAVYDDFLAADSKGAYFVAHIKGQYGHSLEQ